MQNRKGRIELWLMANNISWKLHGRVPPHYFLKYFLGGFYMSWRAFSLKEINIKVLDNEREFPIYV